jgi:hypothetical protein
VQGAIFPFVTIFQSEFADTGHDRMIAPLVARAHARRIRSIDPDGQSVEHALLVPRTAPVGIADRRAAKDQLVSYRDEMVAALDFLLLGGDSPAHAGR